MVPQIHIYGLNLKYTLKLKYSTLWLFFVSPEEFHLCGLRAYRIALRKFFISPEKFHFLGLRVLRMRQSLWGLADRCSLTSSCFSSVTLLFLPLTKCHCIVNCVWESVTIWLIVELGSIYCSPNFLWKASWVNLYRFTIIKLLEGVTYQLNKGQTNDKKVLDWTI